MSKKQSDWKSLTVTYLSIVSEKLCTVNMVNLLQCLAASDSITGLCEHFLSI